MRIQVYSRRFTLRILCSVCILWACVGCKKTHQAQAALQKAPTLRLKLKTSSGQESVRIKVKTKQIQIVLHSQQKKETLYARMHRRKKRKYTLNGRVIAEIKFNSTGWKLRTYRGKTLWKVKTYTDKIKIKAPLGKRAAFEIIKKTPNKLKVRRGSQPLGSVRLYSSKKRIKVKNALHQTLFKSRGTQLSMAYGVALLSPLSMQHRAILMAELLADQR